MMFWGLGSTVALLITSRKVRVETRCFSSTLKENPIESSKYNDLLYWLKANGAEINDKIEIKKTEGCGYGAFVSSNVEQDELLFSIPRKACISRDDAINDPNCGDGFKNLISKAGPGGNTVVLAGYMAKEYLCLIHDIEKGRQPSCRWAPYFLTLPWERGTNNQEHVLFWSDDMVETLLSGSLCYGEATGLRGEVAFATQVMGSITGKSIRVARGEQSDRGRFSLPWEAKPAEEDGPPEGFTEAMKGAFVCLLTRAFEDGDDDEGKMVPMLDMLQHSETPNVSHVMRKVDGTVEVRARCSIVADTELLNQYRSEEEETMPYARFFTRFGFVPGIVEPIENLLEDKSTIFYPQTAEI